MVTKPELEREPTRSLFAGALADLKQLAVGHLGRLQGEMSDELRNLKAYMLKVAIAVGVVVVGAVLGGHTLALVLARLGLEPALAYAIIAVITVGVGIVILRRLPGDKTDVDLVPEQSFAQLKEDLSTVSRAVRH